MRSLVLAALLASPSVVHAAPPAAAVEATAERGAWLFAAPVGYPALLGAGLGRRSAGGTEVIASVGGLVGVGTVIGSGEVVVQHDVAEWGWVALQLGLTGGAIFTYASPIDCVGEDGPCPDSSTTDLVVGPRIGLRFRVTPRRRLPRGIFLELAGGPLVGRCRGDCEPRPPRATAEGRFVVRF